MINIIFPNSVTYDQTAITICRVLSGLDDAGCSVKTDNFPHEIVIRDFLTQYIPKTHGVIRI